MDRPLPPEDALPAPRRRKRPLWFAVLPAFLLAMGSSMWTILRLGGLTPSWTDPAHFLSRSNPCAAVYGVNLYNSEYYSRDPGPDATLTAQNPPRELATVITGMLENKCADPLESATVHFIVQDNNGARWSGDATVGEILPGQAKPFERAWLGQIVSYEIKAIR